MTRRRTACRSRRSASRPATRASRSGASATGPDPVTGPGSAGEAVADEGADGRTDDVEIVEDEAPPAADGEAPATATADAWRGPSIGRWIAFAAIAIGVLVVDQASKAWVTGTLDIGEGIELLGEWLRIVHWRNSGALFGLLPQSAPIFAVVSLGVVGADRPLPPAGRAAAISRPSRSRCCWAARSATCSTACASGASSTSWTWASGSGGSTPTTPPTPRSRRPSCC